MLVSLYVKDFAIVREAELTLGAGLTVVSGETGAGKSLLVDALMLLSGARADAGVVRHGAARAELSARFRPGAGHPALAWLAEQALDDEEAELSLRRVVAAEGGSRAWINGRPATVGQLAELGSLLVEIHGQHEHQALLDRAHQLSLLDSYGELDEARAPVIEQAAAWRETGRRIAALPGASDELAERLRRGERDLAELRRDAIPPDQVEALEAAHRRQSHAAALLQACDSALAALDGEDGPSATRMLRRVHAELTRQADVEPRLAEAARLIDAAAIELDEAARAVAVVRDDLDLDPARLEELDRQLARLHELARRHRVGMDELTAVRDRIETELETLRDAEGAAARLREQLERQRKAWSEAASGLGKARAAAAGTLAGAVSATLAELGMAGARFEASLEPQPDIDPNPQGAERIEFLISANAGQPLRPLRRVASGGELSRISLAIEVAALGSDSVTTMVFDEVDSGIGGAVAEVVGQKLRALGASRQVLCVTHLPQVAAQGHAHLRASKHEHDGSTDTLIEALEAGPREAELARMLGGIRITEETRAHARDMLRRGQASLTENGNSGRGKRKKAS